MTRIEKWMLPGRKARHPLVELGQERGSRGENVLPEKKSEGWVEPKESKNKFGKNG